MAVRVVRVSIIAGAVLAFAVACGGSGPGASVGPTGGAPTGGAPATAAVACAGGVGLPVGIADFTFNPQSITVPVSGVVTWANADSAPHTVTFDDGPDCGRMSQGGTVSRTFAAAGTFAYHCALHPATMKGSVVVQ